MSLLVGTPIRATLLASSIISAMVDDRVFPLIYEVREGAEKYPFLVYDGISINGNETKDANIIESCNVSVSAVSKTYDEAVELANKARHVLEETDPVDGDGIYIDDIRAVGSSVYYDDGINAYVVTVDYEVDTTEEIDYFTPAPEPTNTDPATDDDDDDDETGDENENLTGDENDTETTN